jgi:dynein heavy chain 1
MLFLSFDTDTGLKQALATVNDYNPLMKDFPINDLLSATELDRIRTSVQVSFGLAEPYLFIIYSRTEF